MLRNDLLVISNNTLVNNLGGVEVAFLSGNAQQVISRAFSMAAEGHRLLSHPLTGSVKPNQNPYKSILMSKKRLPVDHDSLAVLNTCLGKTEAMLEDRPLLPLKDEALNDYQMLDFDLLQTGIESLRKGR